MTCCSGRKKRKKNRPTVFPSPLPTGSQCLPRSFHVPIAGDHAHNDLWGLEALAEHNNDSYYQQTVELNTNEYSRRERLTKIGFNVNKDFESHPVGQADADHGIKDGCGMKALGSYPEIRQIWINHLYENWNDADAWENGEGYQPES